MGKNKVPEPTILDESELNLSPDEIRALLNTHESEQGSDSWFEERLGKVTASRVRPIVAVSSYGKPYEDYYKLIIEIALERINGKAERFSNRYTNHGNEYEAWIAGVYEENTGRDVREVGFIEHPTLAAGASCDRFVDNDGTLEIKAPNSSTLTKYLISMIPKESKDYELVKMLNLKGNEWRYYYEQIQMQLWITGRKWCDFCVGDPDMADNLQLIVKRVPRDDEWINTILEPKVIEFLEKVNKLENYLRNYNPEFSA